MTKCPMCGYNEANPNRSQHQYMNQYRSSKTGEICIINSFEPKITHEDGEVFTILGLDENPNAQIPKAPKLAGIPVQKVMLPPTETQPIEPKPPTITSKPALNLKPQQT